MRYVQFANNAVFLCREVFSSCFICSISVWYDSLIVQKCEDAAEHDETGLLSCFNSGHFYVVENWRKMGGA